LITLAGYLVYLSYVDLGAFIVALVAAGLRRWRLAANISRIVALVGLSVFVLIATTVVLMFTAPAVVLAVLPLETQGAAVDPSQKARVLAETISEMMNCAAFAGVVAVLGFILWAIARWRLRAAARVVG
jgi:hypothetical protein